MTAPRYCSHCGHPLGPNARFCASCGKAIQNPTAPLQPRAPAPATPAPVAPPAPAPTETVRGVIPGATRRVGLMGLKMTSFTLVLTDQRIIFAQQTSQMMQENVRQARQAAQQEGKGFFGQWGAQFSANNGQRYYQMPVQQILSEQAENYFLPAAQLRSIRLREEYDEETVSTYRMDIEALGQKERLHFSHLDLRAARDLLRQLYGNIVR